MRGSWPLLSPDVSRNLPLSASSSTPKASLVLWGPGGIVRDLGLHHGAMICARELASVLFVSRYIRLSAFRFIPLISVVRPVVAVVVLCPPVRSVQSSSLSSSGRSFRPSVVVN